MGLCPREFPSADHKMTLFNDFKIFLSVKQDTILEITMISIKNIVNFALFFKKICIFLPLPSLHLQSKWIFLSAC